MSKVIAIDTAILIGKGLFKIYLWAFMRSFATARDLPVLLLHLEYVLTGHPLCKCLGLVLVVAVAPDVAMCLSVCLSSYTNEYRAVLSATYLLLFCQVSANLRAHPVVLVMLFL